jgi:tRNA pseudouridine55 synthase
MSRRKPRGRPLNGWLIVDKPPGLTSTDIVNRVRRAFDAQKAGHGGTLDPLATGVLPVAFGAATKTVPYVMDGTKLYRFILRFGEARDTDDADGTVTATSPVRPTDEQIRAALEKFRGDIMQTPPTFSAVKVAGERAYDMARDGRPPALEPRPARVDSFELIERPDPDTAIFEVASGKGVYMRSLARDLARALGTVGHIAQLRRTAVGPFREEHAISLETLASLGHSAAASGYLMAVATALDDIPALALTADEANRLRCGQPVGLLRRSDLERIGNLESGAVVCATFGGKPVALTRFEAGDLRPLRVLNL